MRTAAALAILFLAQTPGPPPASVEAPAIPGVIAPGTKVELVTYPVQGTEGSVGMTATNLGVEVFGRRGNTSA